MGKLNDAKKKAEEEAAAAKLKEEAAKIQAAADKELKEANSKKAAAEGMIAKIDNAQCKKHSGCKGLEGYCCPTLNFGKMHLGSAKLDGKNLGCCGGAEMENEEVEDMALVEDRTFESNNFGTGAMVL